MWSARLSAARVLSPARHASPAVNSLPARLRASRVRAKTRCASALHTNNSRVPMAYSATASGKATDGSGLHFALRSSHTRAVQSKHVGFHVARHMSTSSRSRLVLEDGTVLEGESFGSPVHSAGEVVFNTGMTGYNETFTDPSYKGQLLVMTYPLIGNYGVPPDAYDSNGLLQYFESAKPQISGLIVTEYSKKYSHWEATRSLSEWLREHHIPAITGVDTRSITKRIREKGTMLGKIVSGSVPHQEVPFIDINSQHLVAQVSPKQVRTYGTGDVHILAVDCGMKYSILRNLVKRGATVTVVPWDHDIAAEFSNPKYHALFISNGPGNPEMCAKTVNELRKCIDVSNPKPIFGICLGHQLIALAAGAQTYKLPYGHRSQNQPCIDLFTQRCYITSQNHGYAVNTKNLPADWKPYFINANDQTSEGLVHLNKPIFSVQFHPEAKCGPVDTEFLFDKFLQLARGELTTAVPTVSPLVASQSTVIGSSLTHGGSLADHVSIEVPSTSSAQSAQSARTSETSMNIGSTSSPLYKKKEKVLILGSGGLQIGQAGEFDYSGSQAIKALKQEGVRSVLINPNIASVQTAEGLADTVYYLPCTAQFVEKIIAKERPDGILLQFGGQTALNTGVELYHSGVLKRYGVEVMGTSVDTIIATEDREIFAKKLVEIGESIADSYAAQDVKEAERAAERLGFPVIVRAAFSLGGLGSGFAHNQAELRDLVTRAFTASPQVLVERSMKGWKELEYEVVRDAYDNIVTVCNMENFDPLGIHTGDSIVIAPSQTLNDHEYHMLRQASINTVRHLGIIGECNVQFALHPTSREYCIIEVNPRLSRSSALASKATGYPLAYVAAKLAMGHSLPSVLNNINQKTTACFEPALDYVVTKIPRWDLSKFSNVSKVLGSGMKSVGEVMGIGRSFEESVQKALRMVDQSVEGFVPKPLKGVPSQVMPAVNLDKELTIATDQRMWFIAQAFDQDYTVDRIHDLTKIDKWFLQKLENIHQTKKQFAQYISVAEIPVRVLEQAKKFGFSDKQIAQSMSFPCTEMQIRQARLSHGITPRAKQIDTLAAEFPAQTNYLYMTYHGTEDDVEFPKQKDNDQVVVLGGGGYRIGSSVEFDYSAVSCIRALRQMGKKTTMINYNPETVSTDYDESDRLFFEELSLERVLDIYQVQKPSGLVISMGGQIPNNLALPLHQQGVPLFGTSATSIDSAEDRKKFSDLLDGIGVSQPQWETLTSLAEAIKFAERVHYPVLVRPSYVLSGGGMKVTRDETELRNYLESTNIHVSAAFPVVVSKFIEGAREIDFDGVAQSGEIIVHAVSEHIENAGVHSGDATLVLPSPNVSNELWEKILAVASKISKALNITGPFNSQLIVSGPAGQEVIQVIECNVRASRSLPFVSKAYGVDFANIATRIMVQDQASGHKWKPMWLPRSPAQLGYVSVKSPQFSFTRLLGADPLLGVEMASTGEVACYGHTVEEAHLLSILASTVKLPKKRVMLSTGSQQNKLAMLPYVRQLIDMGYELFATPGTAAFLEQNNVPVSTCFFELGGQGQHPKAVSLLQNKDVDLVINIPSTDKSDQADEKANCFMVRRSAVDYSIPLITNLQVAQALVRALASTQKLHAYSYTDLKNMREAAARTASS